MAIPADVQNLGPRGRGGAVACIPDWPNLISKLTSKMALAPSKTYIFIYNMYFRGIPNIRGGLGGPLIVEFQS